MNNFHPTALRRRVLQMAHAGSAVHVACAFSVIEILAVLYRNHIRYPENDPRGELRDYLVLSKGHGVMAQYACLYEKGWVSQEMMDGYFSDGSVLKGLSDAHVPGCEVTSGSLGHGLPVGVGMALASKLHRREQYCYAIVGDGELNEGSMWEALLFAAHRKLDNLVVIVDQNGFQAMGRTDDVMQLGDLRQKFDAFGFDALDVDGHDPELIDQSLIALKARCDGRPKALIARTIKGKGVSFMENVNAWHYTRLDQRSLQLALDELEAQA